MKKIIAFLLLLVFIPALISGCGSNKQSDGNGGTTTPSDAQTTENPGTEEPGTVEEGPYNFAAGK